MSGDDLRKEPPPAEIDAHLKRLFDDELFEAPQRRGALYWLIHQKRAGRFKTTQKQEEVAAAFYQWEEAGRQRDEADKVIQFNGPVTASAAALTKGKKFFKDLADALDEYYTAPGKSERFRIRLAGGKGGGWEPVFETTIFAAESPTVEEFQTLERLLTGTLHSYHLTQDEHGNPMWSYDVLEFKPTASKDALVAHSISLPRTADSAEAGRHSYKHEASLSRKHHLLIRTLRDDGTDDMSVQMFPDASGCNFPFAGIDAIARTWHANPSSSISILSNVPLDCAKHCIPGQPITDPEIMTGLQRVWNEAAAKLRLTRLTDAVAIYDDWNEFPAILDTVQRDKYDADTDLRIATIGFTTGSVPDDKLVQLATRGIRIKILLTNPVTGAGLIEARSKMRRFHDRETVDNVIDAVQAQVQRLQARRDEVRNLAKTQTQKPAQEHAVIGDLDFALSSVMPYGFVCLSSRFIVLGLFIATTTYGRAPMIVIDRSASKVLFDTLRYEWDERWKFAQREAVADVAAISSPRSSSAPRWNQETFLEMLRSSPTNAEIRLLTTFFLDDNLFEILDELLHDGPRNVKIMLMDPRPSNNVLLERRYGTGKPEDRTLRKGWTAERAGERLLNQLNLLADLRERLERERSHGRQDIGTLELKVYDTVPTVVHHQVNNEMLLGVLLTTRSAQAGPMLRIRRGDPTWDALQENWDKCWEIGEVWPSRSAHAKPG